MVLALYILPNDVLYLCKVVSKYHKRYSSYRAELLFEIFKKGHVTAKVIQARVIVLVLCILTRDVLYLCKVS